VKPAERRGCCCHFPLHREKSSNNRVNPNGIKLVESHFLIETIATIQSLSSVDDGHLPMYPGEQRIAWRISLCPDPVNILPT
jgi:hypothetical protein